MILFAHMLFGAAIGAQVNHPYLALLLALFGHYFLDAFPHIEYSIHNIQNKLWKKSFYDFLKVFLDFLLGILVISLVSKNQAIIYACALIAIFPDTLTLVNSLFKNKILQAHSKFHEGKIHYLTKQKKFPIFWRITTQIVTIGVSIILLS